ncbi:MULTISPECIES: hypothetical protein [unclassified Streptomyces]|uniref:hypothetical protein n=1 Tax=unclassified Streptomyces TaxID=2593676 RepID=UPI00224D87EE|nr:MULTISPECIES: hypothetical protein [unclassified Streptomyces]MCX5051591.1 hypothetical protein [Streptomyces sp. NBC_00474]MCX5249482.1 hypothetical protein [Streptomyces sp. NBC_00201]
MRPTPKCVVDRSRPCNACIAPDLSSCPYPYLLAGDDAEDPDGGDSTGQDSAHPEE